jgi:hypothetical protein
MLYTQFITGTWVAVAGLQFTCTLHYGRTEHCGQVGNTPASYLAGLGFESRPWKLAILTEVFCGFPQSLQANSRIVP